MSTTTDQPSPEGSTTDRAKAAAAGTASTATDQAKDLTKTAADQAMDVVGHARQQVGDVAGEARQQAKHVMDSTTSEVESQLEQRLGEAAAAAHSTAGELRALAEGRPEDAGRTADLARQAGERLDRLADRVEDLGVRGAAEEVSELARRRPVAFLAGATAAGILLGRLARAGKETHSSSGTSTASAPSDAGTNPPAAVMAPPEALLIGEAPSPSTPAPVAVAGDLPGGALR